MSLKIVSSVCIFAIFVQSISAACVSTTPSCNTAADLAIMNGQWNNNNCGLVSNGFNLASNAFNSGNTLFSNGMTNYGSLGAANGGFFPVSSASPIYPSGVSVLSENAIDGCLDVAGQLPFLATVGMDGQLTGAGSAATQYGCGNGDVGILNEGINSFGLVSGAPYAGTQFYGAPFIGSGYDTTGCAGAPIVNACGNVLY